MDRVTQKSRRPKVRIILASLIVLAVVGLGIYWYLKEQRPTYNRPQEPSGPFEYASEEVSFGNSQANVQLSGTLTIPSDAKGKVAAVILISGYGPQNRDAEWMEHKPFLIIADQLTKQGVAVLRYDDRGFGKSTGDYHNSTSFDFSLDVEGAVDFLKTRKEIDINKIGLIGHSDGAMIAPMVAARRKDISFIVMLAGPGKPGRELMVTRQMIIERKMGKSEKEVQRSKEYMERLIGIIVNSDNHINLKEELNVFAKETKDQIPDDQIPQGLTRDEFIRRQIAMLTSPFFKFFFSYDPKDDLRNVSCPILALCGEKDVQVPSSENLMAIEQAVQSGGNKNITIKELKGLNHMFQECSTGMIDEYAKIDQTFSVNALEAITSFVLHQTQER